MTDRQKMMVENNHNLIFEVIDNLNSSVEELYDTCAIALCEAAVEYKDDFKMTFKVFAKNKIKARALKELNDLDIDTEFITLSSTPATLVDAEKVYNMENDYITDDFVKEIIDDIKSFGPNDDKYRPRSSMSRHVWQLTQEHVDVITLLINGYSPVEIGQCLELSNKYVHMIIAQSRNRLRDYANKKMIYQFFND